MNDYIRREDAISAAIDAADMWAGENAVTRDVVISEELKKLPAADVVTWEQLQKVWKIATAGDVREVKRGKWVKKHDKVCYWYACSECGAKPPYGAYHYEYHSHYCPNCGAEMEETE